MTTNSITFLRDRAKACRDLSDGLNPCADAGDPIKNLLLDHAKQYDAAVDEIERMRMALVKIAAYSDGLASIHLDSTGSYGAFDESGAVQIAREALEPPK